MPKRTLETDYLVVGCGAAGMAFADSLLDASRAEMIMVDRRQAPGGHWLEAYPFVRLHQPSSFYGVNSLPLGSETIDRHGPNEGFYERAGAAEICAYYDRVMQERLLPSGRVRYFPMSSYRGEHRFVSAISGEEVEVKVRKKLVDATYLEGRVPASSPPPFEVAPGAVCVPVGALVNVRDTPTGYVVIGAGKTALDACTWLLDGGVEPSDICWIKPREGWFLNRRYLQGGELVGTMFEGISLQLEAAAQATSMDDLFARLEAMQQNLPRRSARRAHDVPRADNQLRRDRAAPSHRPERAPRQGSSNRGGFESCSTEGPSPRARGTSMCTVRPRG